MNQGFVQIIVLFVLSTPIVASLILSAAAAEPEIEPLPEPREYLKERCEAIADCDFVLLDTIVDCESGWQMVKNRQSSAYGYFQILDSTEATTPQYKAGLSKTEAYANIEMGLYLYETRGSNPWNSSRGCWQNKYYYKISSISPECIGDCEQ